MCVVLLFLYVWHSERLRRRCYDQVCGKTCASMKGMKNLFSHFTCEDAHANMMKWWLLTWCCSFELTMTWQRRTVIVIESKFIYIYAITRKIIYFFIQWFILIRNHEDVMNNCIWKISSLLSFKESNFTETFNPM